MCYLQFLCKCLWYLLISEWKLFLHQISFQWSVDWLGKDHKKNTYCCFKSQFLLQATHPPFLTHTLSLSTSPPTPPTHAPQLASITQHANNRMSLWMIPRQLYSSSDWSADGLYGGHFSPERNFTSPSPRLPTMWSILWTNPTHTHTHIHHIQGISRSVMQWPSEGKRPAETHGCTGKLTPIPPFKHTETQADLSSKRSIKSHLFPPIEGCLKATLPCFSFYGTLRSARGILECSTQRLLHNTHTHKTSGFMSPRGIAKALNNDRKTRQGHISPRNQMKTQEIIFCIKKIKG